LLRATNSHDPHIRTRIVSLAPEATSELRPSLPLARLATVQSGAEYEESQGDRFYTYVPLHFDGQPPMALELSESLGEQDRYIRASVLNNALTLCGIVFVCSILAIALGYVFVGRPMSKLTAKARRIGEGDLSGPLVLAQHDEIAEFAVEMNSMCDRLAEAHDRIEHETQQKFAAVEQLRHADRLRTVGQLASGLAHELGTPLNVVLGRARMLSSGDSTAEETSENAKIIADQASKMTALIRQLLDFARPRGPNFQTVDLRGVVGQTADLLGPLAEKRRVKLVMKPCDTPVEADVDPTQVQQALTNLIVNAMQSMPNGGQVTVTPGTKRANPPADHGGGEQDYRFLSVRDEGDGIAKENLSRIFEPFFTTKGVGEGTGLGLSVTYGIVRDHGGWIEVSSEIGKGSMFTLYIPERRRESVAPTALPRLTSLMDGGSPRAAAIGR
jgi:signal transduction histidine kinase